jgi:predicted DNA-binding antitoxin AbrB/MazE fold protein
MTQRFDAVFERGVFKPAHPVALPEGTCVQVIVDTPVWRDNARAMARMVAEIAASAPPRPEVENTSENVDKILYGEDYGQ